MLSARFIFEKDFLVVKHSYILSGRKEELRKGLVFVFSSALIFLLSTLSTFCTETLMHRYGTSEGVRFEKFGPRADRLLIKLYADDSAEWDALARGEIDMSDWSLSRTYYDLFTSNATNPDTGLPYNETINTVNYGGDFTLYTLDMNNNPNEYLGTPPDPEYPNPVYPNPCSEVSMRQAISYLLDRSSLDTIIGKDLYEPVYTVVPPCEGGFSHPQMKPGGTYENLTYPYSRVAAEALLDAGGFPVNASTGWRFWDRNEDQVEQSDEYLELKFYIRTDHSPRHALGDLIADELDAVKVRVHRIYCTSGTAYVEVMLNRNFHLYIGGITIQIVPEHLTIWCSSCFHPWIPNDLNYPGVDDPEFDEAIDIMFYADTLDEAFQYCWLAQSIFAEKAHVAPLWSWAGNKAMSRLYTGGNKWQNVTPDDGENKYRGRYWEHVVGAGVSEGGIDNFWSFLNMHAEGCKRGDGENMMIRWGFKVPEIKQFNPVYASWLFDWNALDMIYESLLMRNPHNMVEFVPWLAENYEIGTYIHPILGVCTKVRFALRSRATWHDGTPITTADVHYTYVEIKEDLNAGGYPSPSWWNKAQNILAFSIIDPYNFEILTEACSASMLYWIGDIPILPKHIWKPIIESDDPTASAPDCNMIGSGPWRFTEYVEASHILMVANRPGCTVTTSHPDSTPITSPKGYYRYYPVTIETRVDGTTTAKIDYYTQPHTLDYTLYNLFSNGSITLDISLTYPNGTTYNERAVVIDAEENWTHSWIGEIECMKSTGLKVNITAPHEFAGTYIWNHVFWSTIKEDIAGSTFYDDIGFPHQYKDQLHSPDIKVDMKDIGYAARAFGSHPGYGRWSPIADINNDYRVNMRDIGAIAEKFGWTL